MEVVVNLELVDAEMDQLSGILGCPRAELQERLSPFASAAAEEYIRMFLGQRVFTRGSDMEEYRLFLLTKTAFSGSLPDEQRISALFQKSSSGSRSLLRAVMSKYQYDLRPEIAMALRQTLEVAVPDNEEPEFTVTLNSENLVEAMNRILGTTDGTLPQVSKKRGTVASYTIKASAYAILCESCGATAVAAEVD